MEKKVHKLLTEVETLQNELATKIEECNIYKDKCKTLEANGIHPRYEEESKRLKLHIQSVDQSLNSYIDKYGDAQKQIGKHSPCLFARIPQQ